MFVIVREWLQDGVTRFLLLGLAGCLGVMVWGATAFADPLHAAGRWGALGLLVILCTALVCRTITRNTNRQIRIDDHRARRRELSEPRPPGAGDSEQELFARVLTLADH